MDIPKLGRTIAQLDRKKNQKVNRFYTKIMEVAEMRALLCDKEDSTLVAIEVVEAVYDKEEQKLLLYTVLDTCYVVERIIERNATDAICELYAQGKTDLSEYQAYLDDEE